MSRRLILGCALLCLLLCGCSENSNGEPSTATSLAEKEEPGPEAEEKEAEKEEPAKKEEAAEEEKAAKEEEIEDDKGNGAKPWGEVIEGKAPEISFLGQSVNWYAPNKECIIYQYFYEDICVENEGFEQLQRALEEYIHSMKEEDDLPGEQYAQKAGERYKLLDGSEEEFRLDQTSHTFSLVRCDSSVVSFWESKTDYIEGKFENLIDRGVNFDASDGKRLELEDILKDSEEFYVKAVISIKEILTEDLGKSLNQEEDRCVEEAFHNGRAISWCLNAAGISIQFDLRELVENDSGTVEILFPYEKFYDLIKEKYVNPHSELIAQVPQNEDISGLLGEDGMIRFCVDSLDEECVKADIVTDHARAEDAWGMAEWYRAYVLRREDGRSFLLVENNETIDVNDLFVYEVTSGKVRECGRLQGAAFSGMGFGMDHLSVLERVNVLGTWKGWRNYVFGSEGELLLPEEIVRVRSGRVLTVIKDVPITINGREATISEGKHVIVTGTNEKDTVYVEIVEDGVEGEIPYEDHHFINGVEEEEYFQGISYWG